MNKYDKALERIDQVMKEEGIIIGEGMKDYALGRIKSLMEDLDETREK